MRLFSFLFLFIILYDIHLQICLLYQTYQEQYRLLVFIKIAAPNIYIAHKSVVQRVIKKNSFDNLHLPAGSLNQSSCSTQTIALWHSSCWFCCCCYRKKPTSNLTAFVCLQNATSIYTHPLIVGFVSLREMFHSCYDVKSCISEVKCIKFRPTHGTPVT